MELSQMINPSSAFAFSRPCLGAGDEASGERAGSDRERHDAMRCEERPRDAITASMTIKTIRTIKSGVTIKTIVQCKYLFVLLSSFASL
jgi:hypothetical protein